MLLQSLDRPVRTTDGHIIVNFLVGRFYSNLVFGVFHFDGARVAINFQFGFRMLVVLLYKW